MNTASRKLFFAKLTVLSVAVLFAFFCFLNPTGRDRRVGASASGPTPGHAGAPGEANCTACHVDFPVNSGTGRVTIGALPANYLPNQAIPVTVTTAQEDATIYGFQLVAVDGQGRQIGTYTLPAQTPAEVQTMDGIINGNMRRYVMHTVDGIVPTQFGSKTWTFTWNAPSSRAGKVSFYVAGNASNSDGSTAGDHIYTASKSILSGTATANFDNDGTSDLAFFRPSTATWYMTNSVAGGYRAAQFGAAGDRLAPGDYDGDGVTDLGLFRPSSGTWFIQKSSGGFIITQFGAMGDIPVPGDYDGDLKSDLALWRPSVGVWFILRSSNLTYDIRQFGVSTDKIAQADYDGDAKTDIAVFRPSTGQWYVWKSTDNTFIVNTFGLAGDRPVPADYDGDGRADVAVFRPSTNIWYLQRSTAGFGAFQFGGAGDKPVAADYDGDGRADLAVFRPSEGGWYVLRSSDGTAYGQAFGEETDLPVQAAYFAE